jgi:hypothetical protein
MLYPEFAEHCLRFNFKGKFSENASISASASWSEFMRHHPDQSFILIWDCSEMTGFEVNARKEWYRTMKEWKPQIKEVNVVSRNLLIRGAARVMLDFFGLKNQIVKKFEDLKEIA